MDGRVWILGVPFDPLDLRGAVAACVRMVADGRPHLAVTANPEAVVRALDDPEFAEVLRRADLVVADGIGVVWASRRLGRPLPMRVPGIELMEALCAHAARQGLRVFLLGGSEGVAEQAARTLIRRYPGLCIAGTHHGYFTEDEPVVARIAGARADLLFAGMGMPRQEKWLSRHLSDLGVRLAMGVGGSLDVLAGRVRRAPGFVQQVHLEWLYRLLREPRRWRRQLALLRFVWAVLRTGEEKIGGRRNTNTRHGARG